MKKILLLIMGVILFAGCINQGPQPLQQDEYQHQDKSYIPTYDKISDVKEELENYEMKEDTVIYCIVNMEGIIQEYYLSEDISIMRTSVEHVWNKLKISKFESCSSGSDYPYEQCLPIQEAGGYEEIKESWLYAGKLMGKCEEVKFDESFFE